MQNQSSSMPGSGYPDQYATAHTNDSAPTSPPMNTGSLNVQNTNVTSGNCDCNQLTNAQEQVPSDQSAPGTPEAPSTQK